jgi:hypothetical protein
VAQKASVQALIRALDDHFWNAHGGGDRNDQTACLVSLESLEFLEAGRVALHRVNLQGGVQSNLVGAEAWNPVGGDPHDQAAQAAQISECPRDG